jgi:hypothetical protein
VAKSINLVEYATGDDGRLYETKTELIETAFVSSYLLEELLNHFSLVERNIFEAVGSEEHYPIECFDDSDVESVIGKLEEIFILILKSDSERILNKCDRSGAENLPAPTQGYITSKDVEESISRFRTLTNIINVFQLKHNQYSRNASVVLKIG